MKVENEFQAAWPRKQKNMKYDDARHLGQYTELQNIAHRFASTAQTHKKIYVKLNEIMWIMSGALRSTHT